MSKPEATVETEEEPFHGVETIDEMDKISIESYYFEWQTGHAPDQTFREYLGPIQDPEGGDWGRVARLTGLSRDGMKITYDRFRERLPEDEDELFIPKEHVEGSQGMGGPKGR